MFIMGRILLVLAVFGFTFTIDADAKPLYLCDDGKTVLLKDRAELGCPVYQPKAGLITVPDGATWADVEWAVALKQAARSKPSPRMRVSRCEEWIDLILRSDGGLDMETAENTRRWLVLSRIVTTTNLCEEYFTREVYPKFSQAVGFG